MKFFQILYYNFLDSRSQVSSWLQAQHGINMTAVTDACDT